MHRAHTVYSSTGESEAALLERYGSLIDKSARRMAARTGLFNAIDDLWSAGAIGLLDAARRFDKARDVRFESFAEHRIRGAMLDELRRMDHLPRRLRAKTDEVAKAKKNLSQSLGREATNDEVAANLGLDIEEVDSINELAAPHVPLPPDMQTEAPEPLPDAQVAQSQLIGALSEAVAKLPERLQILVSLYYVEGLTYREIADILEVSEPRVCQLHSEAMKHLRGELVEQAE